MHKVLVIGAGKIGSLIATMLVESGAYTVFLADIDLNNPSVKKLKNCMTALTLVKLDAKDQSSVEIFLRENQIVAVVSSLPFFCNEPIAKAAATCKIHYFDLTEDTQTTDMIRALSIDSHGMFVPQCGLAPGFISIVANELMQHFSELDAVKMRVGALPVNISNALQYSLTWSTDGLINEYGNHCKAIENGEEVTLLPLDDLEEVKIDGLTYEAFNTSGGIGSLAESWMGKVNSISYKTIRYPGHCAKIRFLMNDLNLNHDRDTLKRILEGAIPKTAQDVVLVYVSVTGRQDGAYVEENYVRKFYPAQLGGLTWSAIQMTTASSLCAVMDLALSRAGQYRGFVPQEQFSLADFTQSRFGHYYA